MASFSDASFSQAAFGPNAFDFGVQAAVVETRSGGGYWVSPEEWEAYLKKFHEEQRERFAQRAARNGIRAELKEGMFPKPPPKIRHTNQAEPRKEPQTETRFVFTPTEDNTAMRLRIAELVLDLRKRTNAIKKKKRRKKRDEAAIIALLS